MVRPIICPFCGIEWLGEYAVRLHIEERHTANSPFVENQPAGSRTLAPTRQERPSEDSWVKCTRSGCGEYMLISDIDEHLDLHLAAAIADSEEGEEIQRRMSVPTRPSSSSSTTTDFRYVSRTDSSTSSGSRTSHGQGRHRLPLQSGPRSGSSTAASHPAAASHRRGHKPRPLSKPLEPGRLGKRELGPYAFEQRMPSNVRRYLEAAAEPHIFNHVGRDGGLVRQTTVDNETIGIVPVLADLCDLEPDNVATYFCHPSVKHIHRLQCEGDFCGYWSIQMLLSYLQHLDPEKHRGMPNVLEIQSLIEQAWQRGICPYGRIETGGIWNTRKWIGTHEAYAFFTRIKVDTSALSFQGTVALLDYVEAYFISGADAARKYGTSLITHLSPLYFQRLGHSMTVIGLERKASGARNLLVLDSSFATSEPMRRLLSNRRAHASITSLLRPYRRSDASLTRWDEFELLMLVANRTHADGRLQC